MDRKTVFFFILILFLIASIYFLDGSFSFRALFFLFERTVLFLLICGVNGIFFSSKVHCRMFFEFLTVSFFSGVIVTSLSCFTLCGLFGSKVTLTNILIVSVFTFALLFLFYREHVKKTLKRTKILYENISINESICFGLIILVCWYAAMLSYSPGSEFLRSIISWEFNDTTTCWVNATFEDLDNISDIKSYDYKPYDSIFKFPPNITFGNVALSTFFVEIFQLIGWRFIYLFQFIFISLFIFYISLYFSNGFYTSFFISIFCSCSPFFINIETADRNVVSTAVSLFLVYLYISRQKDVFLISFTAGFLATTGLRHLPIIISAAFLIIFIQRSLKEKWFHKKHIFICILGFIFGSFIMWAHFYGSQFTGAVFSEKHSFLGLFEFEYKGLLNFPFTHSLTRLPFFAYPVYINNILMILQQFGIFFICVAAAGCFKVYEHDKKLFYALFSVIVIVLLTLGVQSDWLNKEKLYPVITLFVSLFVFFSAGIQTLLNSQTKKNALKTSILTVFIIGISLFSIKRINFKIDERIYKFYRLPAETKEEYEQNRQYMHDIPIFPDHSRFLWISSIKTSFFKEFPYFKIKEYKKNKDTFYNFNIANDYIKHLNDLNENDNNVQRLLRINVNSELLNDSILSDISKVYESSEKDRIIENKVFYDLHRYSLKKIEYKKASLLEFDRIYSEFANKDKTDEHMRIFSANTYFGIIKTTYFEQKLEENTVQKPAKYLIKNEIWTFRNTEEKIEKIEYITDHIVKFIN